MTTRKIIEFDGTCAFHHRKRKRTRMRPLLAAEACCSMTSPTTTARTARISRMAVLCAVISPLCIEAFTPSPFLSHGTNSPDTPQLHILAPSPQPRRTNNNRKVVPSSSSTSLPSAASAWLFTPDRTANILADTARITLVSTARATTDVALEVATHAVEAAATVTTDTVVRTIYKAPFVSLAISFILGGLFFSTVAAFIAAIIALGKENSRRLREVVGIVYMRTWSVMKLSMQLTMDVLRGKEKMSGFKNRFPAALQAFKDGVGEVKRVFTESVDALKKETQMYSAAVGLPGLIPIQYIFDRIFPSTLTAPFESALQDALLQTAKDNSQIAKLTLKKFTMGDIAPRILEARLFDLGNSDMAFDLEMVWKSNVRADLEVRVSSFGAKIPVTIQNLRFEGPVRLIMVGLRPEEPGWEALLISLPRPPKIGFDIKVAGGLITQIPWLKNEITKALDNAVAEEVLWPRRAVVSAPTPFKTKPLLNPMQILSLMRDDPLLRMERELMASIPDDFRSTYEASSQEDIPDFDIRQVNDKDNNNDEDDVNGDSGGGTPRLRFWQRGKQASTVEAATVDTLKLMAQSLRQEASEAASNVGEKVGMPVMVLEGVEEKRSLASRVLSNLLLPKSLLLYAGRG
mmetsp:Transcript_38112/g.68705  ORF Transcript_38112/g.68705 Transcript_38112/m.68705 type:complete len:631 (-) Transcript_38112:2565-4457(-)